MMPRDLMLANGLEFLDLISDAVLLVRSNGTIAYANTQAMALFGYGADELIGQAIETLVPRQYRVRHQGFREAYSNEPVTRPMQPDLEFTALHKEGHELTVAISLGPYVAAGECFTVCCVKDVSNCRQVKQSLSDCQSIYSNFYHSAPVAMLLLDQNRTITELNRAAESVLGSSAQTLVGLPFGNAVECPGAQESPAGCGHGQRCRHCPIRDIIARTYDQGISHRQVEAQLTCGGTDNACDKYLLISTAAVELSSGRHVFVCLEDISSQKNAELDLRKALAEIQQLRDRLQRENRYLRDEIKVSHAFDEIVGQSEEIRLTLEKAKHVAATDANVLLLGETGTGKGLFAHVLHDNSARRDRTLIKVNCAALPPSLIESELFGHVKGAFTGAGTDKIGRFELADGGTIFLDEIGELDPELQAKLLHVIQEGELERVGGTKTIKVDVRILAATNRDLHAAMKEGTFRPDLYYRLAVFPIEIPPLRTRRDDIPLLAWHFITRKQKSLKREIRDIPDHVMQMLLDYDWPGNVRELENVLERAMILSPSSSLVLDSVMAIPTPHLPSAPPAEPVLAQAETGTPTRLEHVDRAHIIKVLEQCNWRIKGVGNAAERLGLNPSTLRYRMKKLGISRPPRYPR